MKIRLFRCIRQSRLRSGEDGSALVELALSLPMLSLFLLGAVEFARIAYAAIEVTNAAHSAAVYAASSSANATDTTGITAAAQGDSPNLTAGGTPVSLVAGTPAFSCTCSNTAYTPTSCSDNSTCISNNSAMITAVTVQTQTTFTPMISLPGWKPSITLTGKSTEVLTNE